MEEDLFLWNHAGFIPGPNESETDLRHRIETTKQSFNQPGRQAIPLAHWDFAKAQLQRIFDFSPECLPAFYSNRSLMPWQGAASWVENGRISSIQLREGLRKGNFLGLYDRAEILAHEAVHAARSAFPNDPWEEFFAYMTSEKRWRRVLGPIIRRPWEVWPFLLCCIAGPFWSGAFLGASIWAALGFCRLFRAHRILHKASQNIMKNFTAELTEARSAHFLRTSRLGVLGGKNNRNVKAILLRLTDDEIKALARGVDVMALKENDMSLRWRMIRHIYGRKDGRKNCCRRP